MWVGILAVDIENRFMFTREPLPKTNMMETGYDLWVYVFFGPTLVLVFFWGLIQINSNLIF